MWNIMLYDLTTKYSSYIHKEVAMWLALHTVETKSETNRGK